MKPEYRSEISLVFQNELTHRFFHYLTVSEMFSQSLNSIWSCYTIGYTIGWVCTLPCSILCSVPYAKAPMLIFVIPATILAKTSPTSVTNIDVAEFGNNPRTRLNHSRFRIELQSKRKQYKVLD